MKRLAFLLLTLFLLTSNAQVLSSKFDSKNHPKAKGIWATVRYPASFLAKEGERPNIVQKFTGDYNGLFVMLSLQIKDVGAPIERECAAMSVTDFATAFSDGDINVPVSFMKKTKHEEKPAFIYEMSYSSERAGKSLSSYSKNMAVCYKNTIIFVNCAPMLIDNANQTMTSTRRELLAAESLCYQFFNSLVLMDKY